MITLTLLIAAVILIAIFDKGGTGLEALDVASLEIKPAKAKLLVCRIKQIDFQLDASRRVLSKYNASKSTTKEEKSKLFGQMNKLRAERARLIKASLA